MLAGMRPSEGERVVLRGGVIFHVRSAMDIWCVKETWLDCFYEIHVGAVQPGWNVVDIGAGIGDFSVQAARLSGDGAVIALEPFPASFRLLQQNLAANGVANVTALSVSCGREMGIIALAPVRGDALQVTSNASRQEGTSIDSPCITLAEAMSHIPSGFCHLLKLDCEGDEFPILLGAEDALFEKIERIVLEYHDWPPYHHQTLLSRFEKLGYTVRSKRNPVHPDTGFLYGWRTSR